MKKLIKAAAIVMTLSLTVSLNYSFAKPTENANGQIMNSFHQDFKGAELISTKVSKTFAKLTFKQDNTIMCAFYSDGGELLALTRDIQISQLPLNLQESLKKYQSKGNITESFELKSDDQDSYYVTIETAEKKIVLHSNGAGWETFSSTKK